MEKLTPDLSGVAPRGCAVPLAVLKCIGRKSTPNKDQFEAIIQARGQVIARRFVVRTTRNPPSETAMCRNSDDSLTDHPSGAVSGVGSVKLSWFATTRRGSRQCRSEPTPWCRTASRVSEVSRGRDEPFQAMASRECRFLRLAACDLGRGRPDRGAPPRVSRLRSGSWSGVSPDCRQQGRHCLDPLTDR